MQLKIIFVFLSALCGLLWQAHSYAQTNIASIDADASQAKKLIRRLDVQAAKSFPANGPGAVVLVMKGHQVLLRRAYGRANIELGVIMKPEHRFHVASVGKQFTAAAILQLQEERKLKVEDPIRQYFPDAPLSWDAIQIKHLLSHTSGIRNLFLNEAFRQGAYLPHTPQQLFELAIKEPTVGAAGHQFHYATVNYTLLAMIIEKVSGQKYSDYIEQHLLRAAGMQDTIFDQTQGLVKGLVSPYQNGPRLAGRFHPSVGFGGGSFYSTADDLAKWTFALHSAKLISLESLKLMQTRFVLDTGASIPYGFGLRPHRLRQQVYLQSNGDIQGYHTETAYLPQSDIFVAVLSNGESLPFGLQPLAKHLGMIVSDGDYKEPKPVHVDESVLQEWSGVYAAGNDAYQVRYKDGKLWIALPGEGKWNSLSPISTTEFFYDSNPDFRLRFSRDAEGHRHSQWFEFEALDDETDPVLDWQGPVTNL